VLDFVFQIFTGAAHSSDRNSPSESDERQRSDASPEVGARKWQFIPAPLDACASTPHALPAVNMLWSNVGIALGQRGSTHEKLTSITLPREWLKMRDGESWCKYALRPALFLASPPIRLVIHAARPDLVHRATPPTCFNCVANPAKVQGDSVNMQAAVSHFVLGGSRQRATLRRSESLRPRILSNNPYARLHDSAV
jgi:hypothetical protein